MQLIKSYEKIKLSYLDNYNGMLPAMSNSSRDRVYDLPVTVLGSAMNRTSAAGNSRMSANLG